MAQAKDSSDLQAPKGSARDQALFWFARMQSGDTTDLDRAGHAAWLAADPENRREYVKLGQLWCDLDAVRGTRQAASMPIAAAGVSRRMLLTGGVAASLGAGWLALNGLPDFLQSDEYTGIGVMRRATLDDGSVVDLDADTAFAHEFDGDTRNLHLQRGRARFTVAADPRPFRIRAESGVITAYDSRFSIHLWDGNASVAVEEHAVTINAGARDEVRLLQSQRLSFGADAMGVVEPSDPEVETAWLRGKLIFEDRPLRQVLADVNRYRSGRIHVTSDRLLDMRVSGIFDISNPDGVLTAIENTLPVRSTHVTRYLVVLRPA